MVPHFGGTLVKKVSRRYLLVRLSEDNSGHDFVSAQNYSWDKSGSLDVLFTVSTSS